MQCLDQWQLWIPITAWPGTVLDFVRSVYLLILFQVLMKTLHREYITSIYISDTFYTFLLSVNGIRFELFLTKSFNYSCTSLNFLGLLDFVNWYLKIYLWEGFYQFICWCVWFGQIIIFWVLIVNLSSRRLRCVIVSTLFVVIVPLSVFHRYQLGCRLFFFYKRWIILFKIRKR